MTQILKASALLVILSGIFVDVQAEREAEAEAHATTEKPAMAAAQEAKLLAELKTVEDVNSDLSAIEKSDNQKAQTLYEQLVELRPDNTEYQKQLKSYTEKAERDMKMRIQFSAWDGSHRTLEALIKASMNQPYSYEHVKTRYWDMRDHLVVRTTFRGENGFGVVITDAAKAKVSLDGKILKLLREK